MSGLGPWLLNGSFLELYDCSRANLTEEEWYARGSPNWVIAFLFLAYGVITELIYVVVMQIILRKEYQRLSCYKIMACLGIYDMVAIVVNSLISSYFWLIGANFCTHPTLNMYAGALGLGIWCGACMNCLLLVTNRIMDLWNHNLMIIFFGGYRCYLLLTLPLIYCICFMMFTPPILFNSTMTAWFFDPFILESEGYKYYNIPHTINNLAVVAATCFLYVVLCYILGYKYRQGGSSKMTWTQKSIMLQSTAICMANLIASVIYVYMQFFPTPHWLIFTGHVLWQIGHGIPAYVYLLLNKTIQREILVILGIKQAVTTVTSTKPSSQTFPQSL